MNIDLKNFSKNVDEYIKIQDNTYHDILWIDDIDTQEGNFSGKKVAGSGLFTQKLKKLGYRVLDVEDIKQLEGK